jgi:predicted O-linked N-acetylglucosamine transferase (SPINDLY family)
MSQSSIRDELEEAQRLHQSDRLLEADAAYRLVLERAPRNFLALHGLGLIAMRHQRLEEGAALIARALTSEPQNFDALLNLSRARLLLGAPDAALRAAERAVAIKPRDGAAQLARAAALMSGKPPEQSIRVLEQVVEQAPDSIDAWNELGEANRVLGRFEPSSECFRRALQIDAGNRTALIGFARTLQRMARYEDASLVLERTWALWPDTALIGGQLMHCKMMMCDWLRVDELRRRIEADIDAGSTITEPFGLQGYCASPAILRRCAEVFTRTFYPDRSAEMPPAPTRPAGERIRIGYVSGEFRHQATSILLTEVLELHDKSRFEVFAFDNGWDDGTDLRRRIVRAVDELVPIRVPDDRAAAEMVRKRGIDVLVNLNGFFGEARTGLFSLRPAPVQVNYLGFPGTMGAPYIDYILADRWVIPPEQHPHYTEAVVTLPDCYQPNDRRRRISDAPLSRRDVGLPDQAFVFCCFNNTYKVTPEVFSVWMRLLRQVPGSVLWLFANVPEAAANIVREAEAQGIDPSRVIPAPFLPLDVHLARLRMADLFLDTWPYNAHTTGSDALWAGVPVLTVTGDSFPSRVGASLLDAVGLPELITGSLAAYEALALHLARDRAALASLRARLAAARDKAALFDTPRLVRHIEAAYEGMVARARAGEPPAPMTVGTRPALN